MPRLRVTLALGLLVLLLSVAGTFLLSNVQRLGDAVTLDPGRAPTRAVLVPEPRRVRREARAPAPVPAAVVPDVQAAQPQPLSSPAPRYPIEALRSGRGGRVLLEVQLDAGGHVTGATVHRSSGDPALDRAALDAVRGWTFSMPPGAARRTLVPIRFSIDPAAR